MKVHVQENGAQTKVQIIQYPSSHLKVAHTVSQAVISGFSFFQSNITKGGITYPAALQQASVVI